MIKQTSPGIYLLIAALATTLVCCQGNNNQQQQQEAQAKSGYPRIDSFFQALVEYDKAFGAVAIREQGDLSHNQAYGYSRLVTGDTVPATVDTRYHIGSITKTFTATLIMQLVEADKLSLDTRLAKFYPKMPKADSITIEHMLRHQSGLYNFTDTSWMASKSEYRSKDAMLAKFRKYESQFSPGSQFQYSNTNYVLLGYIIENLTGKSYAKALKERIAEPLNLTQTHFPDAQLDPNEARSFQWQGKHWDTVQRTDHRVSHGAGALLSTPADLTRFFRGLFTGKLVDTSTLNQMTDLSAGPSQRNGYGLGLFRFPFGQRTAYGHTGGIDGYRAQAAYFPADSMAMAITTNALNYGMNQLAIGVLKICFDQSYTIPDFSQQQAISLDTARLKRFAGEYASPDHPLDITLRVQDGSLYGQATGQPAFPLTATSDTSFKYAAANIEIRFRKTNKERFQAFYLRQGGKFLFKRE